MNKKLIVRDGQSYKINIIILWNKQKYITMEGVNNQDNKVIVKASDILKKLKSPTDRKNFALENSKR